MASQDNVKWKQDNKMCNNSGVSNGDGNGDERSQAKTNKQASKQTKSSKKHKCAQAYLYTESTCV